MKTDFLAIGSGITELNFALKTAQYGRMLQNGCGHALNYFLRFFSSFLVYALTGMGVMLISILLAPIKNEWGLSLITTELLASAVCL